MSNRFCSPSMEIQCQILKYWYPGNLMPRNARCILSKLHPYHLDWLSPGHRCWSESKCSIGVRRNALSSFHEYRYTWSHDRKLWKNLVDIINVSSCTTASRWPNVHLLSLHLAYYETSMNAIQFNSTFTIMRACELRAAPFATLSVSQLLSSIRYTASRFFVLCVFYFLEVLFTLFNFFSKNNCERHVCVILGLRTECKCMKWNADAKKWTATKQLFLQELGTRT